jgi:hypothetical protein
MRTIRVLMENGCGHLLCHRDVTSLDVWGLCMSHTLLLSACCRCPCTCHHCSVLTVSCSCYCHSGASRFGWSYLCCSQMPLGTLYLRLCRSRGCILSLGLAWSRHHIPSLDISHIPSLALAVVCLRKWVHITLPRGGGLALDVTVALLWVWDGGVGSQGFMFGWRYNILVALGSTRQCCIRHIGIV